MTKILFSAIALFGFLTTTAQTGCSKFYSFEEGTHTEITSFDKKGKKVAIVDYTVLSTAQTTNGKVATMKATIKDEKGETIVESEYDISCDGTKISIDYHSMVSPMMMNQFKDVDYDISGTNLEIPNNLSVGQTLPDAQMNMNISMSGITMKMELTTTDRKVIGKEEVTTPAGTFNCYVLTSNTITKMGMTQTSETKQWIAEGVGMVKQESYNKGDLISSSVLTEFSK